MKKKQRARSLKSGLPPGSIVHIGHERTIPPQITHYRYDTDLYEEHRHCSLDDVRTARTLPGTHWIEVDGIHDPHIIKQLGEIFGIHYLVLEDIANTNQRPKKEDFDDYIYVVMKMIQLDTETRQPLFEQVSFILGKGYILSFQERERDCFDSVRARLKNAQGRIRKLGADYLLYSLLDTIVDHYFVVLEQLGEALEIVEEELVDKPSPRTLPKIYDLKRSMLAMRRAVWPVREVLSSMTRADNPFIQRATHIYFRDIYDHAVEIIDIIENAREMSAGMIDVYLSSMSNKLNEVMRVLTVITTIFMPLTFIVGIYGMNFHHMPELSWHYGYPIVLMAMFILASGMLLYFKKRRWL